MEALTRLPFFFGFINNFMDYLTTYYKNLCSQLEEKLNGLQSQLNEGRFDSAYIKPNRYKNSHFNPAAPKDYFNPHAPGSEGTEWAPKPWLHPDQKPEIPRSGRLEPDYKDHKVNIDDVTRELRKRSDRLNVDKKFPDTDNINVPDSFYNPKLKEKTPHIQRYGNPDAIDIMPEPRKDLVSSVNKEPRPAFNIDLNLLRDRKLSDPRNRDEIDFSEIKNKLSRVAKNI